LPDSVLEPYMSEDKKNIDSDTMENSKKELSKKKHSEKKDIVEKPEQAENIENIKDKAIDPSETDQSEKEPLEQSAQNKEQKSKKTKLGIFVFFLFILLIALAFAGGFAYLSIEKRISSRAEEQTQSLQTNQEALQQQISALYQNNQRVENSQSSLQTALTALQSDSERQMQALALRIAQDEAIGAADWTLAEVEYLLNIANQRLATSKDSQTAIEMLEQADGILVELAYPELIPARRQIREDLTALKLVRRVDTEGLYFDLEALTKQLQGIQDFSPEYLAFEPRLIEDREEIPRHKKLWNGLVNAFKQLVRVQSGSDIGEPVYLESDEQSLTRQLSLQLQLRHAQLALLATQQSVFEGALNSAVAELSQYYPNSEKASGIADRLRVLASTNIQVDDMNINDSIRALSSVVDQLSKAEQGRGE